jgi:hypothetical protein
MMSRQRNLIIPVFFVLVLLVAVALFRSGSQAAPEPPRQPGEIQRPAMAPTPVRPQAPARPQLSGADGKLLFQDTFESAASDKNWTAVDIGGLAPGDEPSRWGAMDGIFRQLWTGQHYAPRPGPTMAVAGSPDWTDYTIQASVYPEANIELGVVFRRQGDSFYRFRVVNKNYRDQNKIVLEKVTGGKATVLAVQPGPGYTDHQWYTLTVTARGSRLEARINDEPALTAEDASLSHGQIGLYGIAIGDLGFDNVTVVAP